MIRGIVDEREAPMSQAVMETLETFDVADDDTTDGEAHSER